MKAICVFVHKFLLAVPCGDIEVAKKFYSETLGCRLDNSAQEWADVDFWGNELTLHANEHQNVEQKHYPYRHHVFHYPFYVH